ncbi:VOC family protein [Fulvivirgaceae bacterium BMA10]|uniref:VOC family protein n=1 Tax=Splendidivirga corallicola TaxID=3051826 RepID=A0ABT8KIK3_9BACT|nr:VOC family protein [Fulvivirgaceae bacterium BMA10]
MKFTGTQKKMKIQLGRVVILVDDFDQALHFYQTNFFCHTIFDNTTPEGKRYLHIGFSKKDSIGIWFLKAESDEQEDKVGKQTAGQPTVVLYTEDIEKLYTHVKGNGVKIVEKLVEVPGSKFFHCLDLYGNRITVVELTS